MREAAQQACGLRMRHAAGLVLTAIALAAAGAAVWKTGMTGECGYMMDGDGGRAGTARASCGNDRYDGEIHYPVFAGLSEKIVKNKIFGTVT